jgi:Type III secretion system lipoprotein chaperone (YscW)
MPPDAVLTVRVENISRADTKADILAETTETFENRQVPIDFTLNIPALRLRLMPATIYGQPLAWADNCGLRRRAAIQT